MNILFYSLVMHPHCGGYISSSESLIEALRQFADVILVVNDGTLASDAIRVIADRCKIRQVINKAKDDDAIAAEALADFRPKIIFINGTNQGDYIHKFFGKTGVPVVVYEHQLPDLRHLRREVVDRVSMADRVCVPSNIVAERFSTIAGSKLHTVPLPIDTDLFKKQNESTTSDCRYIGCNTLITVCKIKPVRNIEGLLAVTAKVKREIQNLTLQIIGEPPHDANSDYLRFLQVKAAQMGLKDTVLFNGPVKDKQKLARLLSEADLYVDVAKEETFGQAKLEALACGTFVATLDVGNNKELFSPDTRSFLCRDADEITALIVRLLTKKDLTEELEKKSRDYVLQNYSMDPVSARLKEILDELL